MCGRFNGDGGSPFLQNSNARNVRKVWLEAGLDGIMKARLETNQSPLESDLDDSTASNGDKP
jgi:hypothetical protein